VPTGADGVPAGRRHTRRAAGGPPRRPLAYLDSSPGADYNLKG